MNDTRDLPLSMVTLIFGVLSIPLAFAVHLVSLAVVMAALAILFNLWGRWRSRRVAFSAASLKRSRRGFLSALVGLLCAMVMWWLWASNALLEH
jgi:hypothetical protein